MVMRPFTLWRFSPPYARVSRRLWSLVLWHTQRDFCLFFLWQAECGAYAEWRCRLRAWRFAWKGDGGCLLVCFCRLTVGRWQTSTVAHKIFILRNFLTFTRIFTPLTRNVHERANFGQIRLYGYIHKYGWIRQTTQTEISRTLRTETVPESG